MVNKFSADNKGPRICASNVFPSVEQQAPKPAKSLGYTAQKPQNMYQQRA